MADMQKQGSEKLLSPAEDLEILFRKMYPGLPFKDALYAHIGKQTKDQEKKDLDQNKLINAQSNEINKLNAFIKSIDAELQDFENLSKRNDRDIERLKQLAGALKTSGEERRGTIKVSDQQLQSLRTDLDALRNKPGAEPEQIQKLQAEIEKAKSGKATSVELEKLQKGLDALTKEPRLNPEEIEKTIADIKKGYEGIEGGLSKELEKARQDLESKERRFRTSIARNAEKLKSFGNNFKTLDDKVKDIDDSLQQYSDLPKKLKGIENKLVKDFENKLNDKITNITGFLDSTNKDIDRLSKAQWRLAQAVKGTSAKDTIDIDGTEVSPEKAKVTPLVRPVRQTEPEPEEKVTIEPKDDQDQSEKSRYGKQSSWGKFFSKQA